MGPKMELLGGQIFFAHFKVISDGFLGKSFKKISRAEQVIFSGRAHLKHQNMAKQSVEKYNSALFLACNFTIVVQESGEMILLFDSSVPDNCFTTCQSQKKLLL